MRPLKEKRARERDRESERESGVWNKVVATVFFTWKK
jgi:hypothetical protein